MLPFSIMLNPHTKLSPRVEVSLAVASFSLVLLAWIVVTSLHLVSEAKLPGPLQVLNAFTTLTWSNGQSLLGEAVLSSVTRIASAAFFVLVIGIPVGIIMGASPVLNSMLSPLVDPFRSAPIVALLPIFVMWFGIGEEMKIAFLFTCSVVYLVPLVRDAVVSVPYSYWESAKDLGATNVECITKTVLPIAAPRIFDASVVSISILWTYITVAEYVNATNGLGQLIQNARRFSAMDQVFVGIFTIIALALVTYGVLTKIRNTLYHWEKSQ